jgi:hypothetical protein
LLADLFNNVDQWQVFGRQNDWRQLLLEYAQAYNQKLQPDWLSFKTDIANSF